jgi:UDP-3-O-[3-hydroxymyristoyl] glucosamine N-acyltransferase
MPLDNATRGAITFCRADLPNARERVQNSKSEVIITSDADWTTDINSKWLLEVDDPYACFIDVCNHFFPIGLKREIHPSAAIAPGVNLGENVAIGANAVVQHATIGDNVTIYPGAVIGADGFGFAHTNRDDNGALIRFPHYGNVIIEDDVEIGANAVIDRGTLGSTIIRKGVKIDNLVHVAHNADIGEHTALVAHSMIAGSVTIGSGSWIAPHVAIRDRQTIGKNVVAGLGAVIVNDVEDDQTVIGVPAKAITKYD